MAADSLSRWRHRLRARTGTVRLRSTVAAVLVVGVALIAGAVAMVTQLRTELTGDVRAAAWVRVNELVAALEAGQGTSALRVAGDAEQLEQVLDPAGQVVASSPNVAGRPAVAHLRSGDSAKVVTPVDTDLFLAVAQAANTPNGPRTVIVARALIGVNESVQIVTRLLAIGLPLLLVMVTLATWKAVGYALAPVEAIRSEVDEISAAQLHRRVPQPSGRDEIALLAATMNRMLARLEGAQRSQRRFISDASHELRSPVASIRQHAEVARAHPDRTNVTDLAATVLAEGLRMQYLVDDLLLLARFDEHTLRLWLRPVDLDDLVFDEAHRLRTTTTLRIDTRAVSAGRVDGDPTLLARILRNLCDNAARYARTQVRFALATQARVVVLTVDDDGSGIAGNERHRVFERFVRLDDARGRDEGGAGLGLAIVAELVNAHGGTAAVTNSDLGGARIEVTLPSATTDS